MIKHFMEVFQPAGSRKPISQQRLVKAGGRMVKHAMRQFPIFACREEAKLASSWAAGVARMEEGEKTL